MKRYIFAAVVIIATVLAGFIMPPAIMEWKDEQRLEKSEVQAAEEVVLTSQTELTMIEKLQLMQSDTITRLPMEQGEHYDWDSIIVKVQQEIKKLCELEIFTMQNQEKRYGVEEVEFIIDIKDGTKSMMLWTVHVVNDEECVIVTVDDETGKIMSILHQNYWTSVSVSGDAKAALKVPEANDIDLNKIAEKWAEYLDVDLVETSVYDKTIASGLDEMQKEIDALVEKGMDEEEAYTKIYEEWGLVEEIQERRLYAVYEDSSGMIVFMFRKNNGDIFFMADLSK